MVECLTVDVHDGKDVAGGGGRERERRAAGPGGERVADGRDVGICVLLRVEHNKVSFCIVVGGA